MRLGEICSVHSGLTLRGRLTPSATGALAIQQGDVADEGPLDSRVLVRIDAPMGRYATGPGDVLFRSRGKQTQAWVVPESLLEPAIAVMPLFILRPRGDGVDPQYLAWVLNQPEAQRYFRQSSQGQTIQMISKPVLEAAPLVLPSLDRQRQIAAAALLASRQESLECLLLRRRYELLSLRLADAAKAHPDQVHPDEAHQNRTTR